MHSAKVIADSIYDGNRITTLEVVMPRIILAEFNTHRMFSRNSASSRAIPVQKMLDRVKETPYIPTHWGKNQKGMSASDEIDIKGQIKAEEVWSDARDAAVMYATRLMELGVHKQITNRLLEPFMWHTVIVTATEWQNFFNLRDHSAAHPDIQLVARAMKQAIRDSVPKALEWTDWHTPYVDDDNLPIKERLKVSVARCARVSYMRHDGESTLEDDFNRHDDLLRSGHMSPFEHQAQPFPAFWSGNFWGWQQYRKTIPGESVYVGT